MTPRRENENKSQTLFINRDVDALLTEANLLRVRGDWVAATEKCMEAMRVAPGHAAAQSLLGDIYEGQGFNDEAIQWYRMALDANPNSASDKQKLGRLLAQRGDIADDRTWFSLQEPTAVLSSDPSRRTMKTLRIASFAMGFAVLAVIFTAAVDSKAFRSRAGGTSASVDAAPVLLGPAQTDIGYGASASPRDIFEAMLSQSMRSMSNGADASLRFADVLADPRSGRLTVTYVLKQSSASGRDAVLKAALRAAEAASKVRESSAYQNFTVRILAEAAEANAATGGSLIFIGDITRMDIANYPGDPANLPEGQAVLAFSNQWWSPSLPV